MRLWPFLHAVLFAFGVSIITSHAAAKTPAPDFRPGELLVRYKPGYRAAALADYARDYRIRALKTLNQGRIQHLVLPPEMSVAQAMALYAKDPAVAFAEPNYYLLGQTLPDDPLLTQQWGLNNTGQQVSGYVGTPGADIEAPAAWDITSGRSDIVVAVVDSGVAYNHPDLASAIWTNPVEIPANGLDDDHNGRVDDVHGWDFVHDDNDPMDATGHGTHVAGIIAAQKDNALGIAGVAGRITIMPLRFMDALDRGTIADAIAAIDYALSQGARIINCSWGSTGYSAALKETMAAADALFVCAAGNEGTDNDHIPFYPASFNLANVLSVAASDQMDHLTWFSNFGGQSVDVTAPGIRIYSLNQSRRVVWMDDFDDADIADWQAGGDSPGWTVLTPPYASSTPALASNPAGGYSADMNTWLVSPGLDLSQASATTLSFYLIGGSQPSSDYLRVEVSTDLATWYTRPLLQGSSMIEDGISGSVPYWMPVQADLGSWDGQTPVYIRLRFTSDASVETTGYYVDNLSLTAADVGEQYQFMHGTSMAAAFATGVAALVLSQDPGLEPAQVRAIIEKSVDLDYGLLDEVATAGRINAYNALTLLSDLTLTAQASTAGVSLTWAGPSPLSASITIERRADDQSVFQQIAQVSASESGYIDATPTDGGIYYYRVQAETQDGRSGYSPQVLADTDLSITGSGTSSGGSSGGGGCFLQSLF